MVKQRKAKGTVDPTREWSEFNLELMFTSLQIYGSEKKDPFDLLENLLTSHVWDKCIEQFYACANNFHGSGLVKAMLNDQNSTKSTLVDKATITYWNGVQRYASNSDGEEARYYNGDVFLGILDNKKILAKAKLMALTTKQLRYFSDKSRQWLLKIISDKTLLRSAYDYATSSCTKIGELTKTKVR